MATATAKVSLGRDISASQQQHPAQKSPEHQADREGERPVHFLKIQPGLRQQVDVLQNLGTKSDDDRRRQNRRGRYFSIRQHPVNQKEHRNAGGDGKSLHHSETKPIDKKLAMPVQQKLQRPNVASSKRHESSASTPQANASPSDSA